VAEGISVVAAEIQGCRQNISSTSDDLKLVAKLGKHMKPIRLAGRLELFTDKRKQ
jgi:hypothetical protein